MTLTLTSTHPELISRGYDTYISLLYHRASASFYLRYVRFFRCYLCYNYLLYNLCTS